MPQFVNKDVILAKIETTYGTDSVPTGAANSMLVRNLSVTPIEMVTASRDLRRAFFGNSEQLPSSVWASVEFEIELAGSGTAGTAPAYAPLLRACGMTETVAAGTSVTYAPNSLSSPASVTLYTFRDGVRQIIAGARGSVAFSFPNQGIPTARFRFLGRYAAPTDTAPTGVTYSAFQRPLPCNAANTAFLLHGFAAITASIDFDVAVETVFRDLIGGTTETVITGRAPGGSVQYELPTIAQFNYFTRFQNATLGAMSLQHGTVAGNRVDLAAPNVQLVSPTYQESDNVVMLSANIVAVPGAAGNDEFTLTVR
jgi:hypothetical protein